MKNITSGRSSGVTDVSRDGSSDSFFAMMVSRSARKPGVTSRIGASTRRLIQRAINHAPVAGTIPARMPQRIVCPTSRCRFSAMASGPGCGATSECVMVPPQQIAST